MQTVTYLLGVRGLVQLRGPERTITLKFEIELWREATDAVDAALNDREHDRRRHGVYANGWKVEDSLLST